MATSKYTEGVVKTVLGSALSIAPALWCVLGLIGAEPDSPIRFEGRTLPFRLDSCETRVRHAPATMAGGVAVFDYNNDGRPDIFFTNGADIRTLRKDSPKYWNRLYRNDGGGRFTDVTEAAGLAGAGYDIGAAVADYDNDGYPDLFVAGVYRNTLYHNNGDGTFTDVTAQAGLNTGQPDPRYGPLWAVGAAWVDVNNDGLLDLFVVNYLQWTIDKEPICGAGDEGDYCHPKLYNGSPNRLWLNQGKGRFADVSEKFGIRGHVGKGMSVSVADYDLDGWPDLFVTNDKAFNFLFHNKAGTAFEEVAFPAGVALADDGAFISGMGSDFRDIDNDEYPDLHFVALNQETFPLFFNLGNGKFRDGTFSTGLRKLSLPMAGFSTGICDLDNDGWKDLLITRGHVESLPQVGQPVQQQNSVFRNPGAQGKWTAMTEEAGFTALPAARHRGHAFGDFDGDGRIDVVVSALSAPAELWMNTSPGAGHWLGVRLQGTRSNRDGIGARIKVTTRSGVQYNHMTTAVGYASSSYGPVHFGRGPDDTAQCLGLREARLQGGGGHLTKLNPGSNDARRGRLVFSRYGKSRPTDQ